MKLHISLVTLLTLLAVAGESYAESKRYIVLGDDIVGLKNEVITQGGDVDHDLVYHAGFVANMPAAVIEKLAERFGNDVFVEEDAEVTSSGKPAPAPSPAQSTPWGITGINADDAWAVTGGAGVTVCVVDTGIQSSHPDLTGQVIGGENFVFNKGVVDPAKWDDDNGHGTHVAGTIAALNNTVGVVGVAPNASLFAVKVLDRRGSGYMSDVADGIASCVLNGADVINMSLGSSSDSSLVSAAVVDAYTAGVILVAAAGNNSAGVSYPAKYPEVIAVSAVDSLNALAYFSNTGVEIDFTAPGVSVYSTYKGSAYATLSGTSMASPHVAGVAALMRAAVRTQLLATDIGLLPEEQGAGLIDAWLSVQ